jgi:hypothetical protein
MKQLAGKLSILLVAFLAFVFFQGLGYAQMLVNGAALPGTLYLNQILTISSSFIHNHPVNSLLDSVLEELCKR